MEAIASDIFRASIPLHIIKVARILLARGRLKELYEEKRRDDEFDYVIEMFKIFNDKMIRGTSVEFINDSVERYANKPQTLAKLDQRVLEAVRGIHQARKTTGIVSAGYMDGIIRILRAAGCTDCFDFCEGDTLKSEGNRAVGFELKPYKRKHEVLARLLRERNLDVSTVAYMGDSDDDEGCFQIVGHPIVSFFAPDDLKQKYAQSFRAFVPKNETELMAYLSST